MITRARMVQIKLRLHVGLYVQGMPIHDEYELIRLNLDHNI